MDKIITFISFLVEEVANELSYDCYVDKVRVEQLKFIRTIGQKQLIPQ